MLFGITTLFVAISISAIAAYYSIVGLTAIFAAAFVPIILMGGVLEVGKIFTTVWLHQNWNRAPRSLKIYLTSAVIVLMFITSMGVFGFLSKAHIEQTAQSEENLAKLETINSEIARQQAIIQRAEEKIRNIETQGSSTFASIQNQIDREQARIDSAYDRIAGQVAQQNSIIEQERQRIEQEAAPFVNEVASIDEKLLLLQQYIQNNQIRELQQLIGARPDGVYGSRTAEKVQAFRNELQDKKLELSDRVRELRQTESPRSQQARQEIQRLNNSVNSQIEASNELIGRLRQQLGQGNDADAVEQQIEELNADISEANQQMDTLTEEKFGIEAEYRKLEAEVGPVKFIAELVYGETNQGLLEDAVRWVIIILVAVFDPLAVMLVLAGTMTLDWAREDRKKTVVNRREQELLNKINQLETDIKQRDDLLIDVADRVLNR